MKTALSFNAPADVRPLPRALVPLIFLAVSVTMALPAWGQESIAPTPVELAPIEVKGYKDGRGHRQTTESVTVLRDDGTAESGSESGLEYLNGAGNVQVNRNGESFSIRGINSAGVTGYQVDNLSSVLVDDIFQTDLALAAGGFDVWGMERIEIHRGAQSTTQGVNSLAGTILLYREDPRPQTTGAARIGYGTFNARDFAAIAHRGWLEGRLRTSLSYHKELNQGYITNVATDNERWGSRNQDDVTAKLAYRIGEREELGLTLRYLNNDRGGSYVQGANPFDFQVDEDIDLRTRSESQQAALRHEKELRPGLDNKALVTWTQSLQRGISDADRTSQPIAGTRYEKNDDRYVSIEDVLQLRSGRLRNTLGLHAHFYQLDDVHDFNLLFPVNGSSTPIDLDQTVTRKRRSLAVFDTASYQLTDSDTLQLGLRIENVESRYGTNVEARRLQDLGPAGNATVDAYLQAVDGSYGNAGTDSVVLPKIGFVHDFGSQQVGLAYTEGFRTGGLSINRRRATAVGYEPERTHNYELSYKFRDVARPQLELEANAFYIDWRSQQVLTRLSGDFYDTQVVNAASSRLWGGEAQARYNGADDRVAWAIGHVETEFRSFNDGQTDYVGKQFPFAARWTTRLSYSRDLTDAFSVTTTGRYLSRSFTDAENTRVSPDQVLVDLSSLYNWGAFAFEVYAKNLLDRQTVIFDGRAQGQASYVGAYNLVTAPREFGTRIAYYW